MTKTTDNAPIDEQARKHAPDSMTKLITLMAETKDQRLQFWVARYLLELAYGRTPTRKTDTNAADELTPEEQRKLDIFNRHYERLANKGVLDRDEHSDDASEPEVLADNLSPGVDA